MFYEPCSQLCNKVNSKIKTIKVIFASTVLKWMKIKYFIKNIELGKYSFLLELSVSDIGLSRQLYFTGWREYYSTLYYIKYLERCKPSAIIDLGSNIGYFACIAKTVVSKSKIWCIEPVLNNYNRLNRNIQLNGYSDTFLFKIGIGDTDEHATIYTFDFDNWATFNSEHANKLASMGYKVEKDSVRIMRLETFCKDISTNIDLLRMDIEGYEYEVINKNIDSFKEMQFDVFMEFHTNILGKEKTIETLQSLLNAGYINGAIIFNNPFCDKDEYFRNTKHFPKFYSISNLIKEFNGFPEDLVKKNDGFEIFLSKKDGRLPS